MAALTAKNPVVCLSVGPRILAFDGHSSANFHSIFNCFMSNFKLKYEKSENIKADRVNTIVFNLRQTKHRAFLGHPVNQIQIITVWQKNPFSLTFSELSPKSIDDYPEGEV